MALFDAKALLGAPWKNGGGVTRTIAASPPGGAFEDFDWRVSIADIQKSGAFSAFPGVDRTIVLLSGAGMVLKVGEGVTWPLTALFEPYSFSGDESVDAKLVGGPAEDFNVMTRRGRAQAVVKTWRSEIRIENTAEATLLYCARGGYHVEGAATLRAGWVLSLNAGAAAVRCIPETGHAVMITVQISKAETRGAES